MGFANELLVVFVVVVFVFVYYYFKSFIALQKVVSTSRAHWWLCFESFDQLKEMPHPLCCYHFVP